MAVGWKAWCPALRGVLLSVLLVVSEACLLVLQVVLRRFAARVPSRCEKSTTYPTRLETRTKKSSKCASHWVENSYGVMKVKVGVGRLICDPWACSRRNIAPCYLLAAVWR